MTELLSDLSYVNENGDVLPPDGSDDLGVSSFPEASARGEEDKIEIDNRPDDIEQELLSKILPWLLAAHDETDGAQQKGIHQKTRTDHLRRAGELRAMADALIVELPSFIPGSDPDRALIAKRAELREEALAARVAAQKAEVLGRAAQKRTGLDVKSLAAGEGVIRPYDED